jgi:hypothetical protein
LPFEDELDWDSHLIRVPYENLASLEDYVLDFHQQLSPRKFIQLQHACREFWLKYLSPEGYFSHLSGWLKRHLRS